MTWQRTFRVLPTRTIEGETVWLRYCWERPHGPFYGGIRLYEYSSAPTPPAEPVPAPPSGGGSGRR